jgi:AraC-like DNA-binding protein
LKFSTEEISEKQQQLREVIEREEIYKDEKLNVEGLARYLGWPARDVTIIISEAFDTNFNDLINTYRVKAFKDLVTRSENKKYSIMGIAQEVGFNSKASFYRAFKKESGQTPSEFLISKDIK